MVINRTHKTGHYNKTCCWCYQEFHVIWWELLVAQAPWADGILMINPHLSLVHQCTQLLPVGHETYYRRVFLIRTCVYIYIFICVFININMYIHKYMDVCVDMYIYIYLQMCIHIFVQICIHKYIYIQYIEIYLHRYIYIYI